MNLKKGDRQMGGDMNPVFSVSPEEIRKRNLEIVEKLCPESIFETSDKKIFVVIKKISKEEMSLIELDEINMSRIISGKTCSAVVLKIQDIINTPLNIIRF